MERKELLDLLDRFGEATLKEHEATTDQTRKYYRAYRHIILAKILGMRADLLDTIEKLEHKVSELDKIKCG